MNNIVWLESIKTEKGQIDTKNAKLPQVESYAEFWNILTNQKREAIYTKVDTIDEITIIPDVSNNPSTPEQNKYAIQKEQKTNNGTIQVQLCYVVGKAKIENFLSQYIRHDIKQYKELVQIQINETTEKTETILSSQQELSTLVDEITEYDYTPEWVKDYFKNATALHKDIQKDYDASYKLIKDRQKNGQKPTLLEKNMLKLLEHKYMKDTKNIEQLEKTIKSLGKEYKKETNVDMWKQNSKETYLQLLYYRSQWQKLSGLLHNESAQKNFVDNPDIYMDIPVESTQDAALLKTVYDNMSKERFRINELLTDANFKNIKDKNGQTMQDYLNSTLEEWSTAKEPFVPSSEYQSEYNEVLKNYPQLQEWMQTDPTDKTQTDNNIVRSDVEDVAWRKLTDQERSNLQFKNKEYKTRQEKALPQQYLDFINQTDLDADSKRRITNFSWFVVVAWLIALWITAISKVRKREKGSWRWRWLAWAATVWGLMYMGWWSINKASTTIADRFGSKEYDPKQWKVENIYGAWLINANTLFAGMTYRNMNRFIKKENDILKMDYAAMESYLNSNPDKLDNIQARKSALENLKNSDKYNLLHLALSDWLWLSKEKLENPNNGDITYESIAMDAIKRISEINEFMDKNGYVRWNNESTEQLTRYIREWKGSLESLANIGIFEKDVPVIENNTLKTQINQLTILTTQKEKDNLYKYGLKLKQELKEANKYEWDFEFIQKNNKLYLKSYNQETEINMQNKKLWNIPLYTTYQTLKGANLTNRLQDIFKGKADTEKPFNISVAGGDIEFQKKSLTSTEWWKDLRQFAKDKFDTEAVAAWRWWTLKNIAPSLEDNKQAYIDYLNALPWRKK